MKTPASSIEPIAALGERVRKLQASGQQVVFTNGCFDILHSGHIELLRRSRELGDVLIVAINDDSSVRRLKGPGRPVFDQEERAEVLAALEMVDFVCVFRDDTPLETILGIRPDVLAKGADWADKGIVGSEEVAGWGGTIVTIPMVDGKSTTDVVARIIDRAAGGGASPTER